MGAPADDGRAPDGARPGSPGSGASLTPAPSPPQALPLRTLLGALLQDLQSAQDQATRHSVSLLGRYAHDPLLSLMEVPVVRLGDSSLTLRFAVSGLAPASPGPETSGLPTSGLQTPGPEMSRLQVPRPEVAGASQEVAWAPPAAVSRYAAQVSAVALQTLRAALGPLVTFTPPGGEPAAVQAGLDDPSFAAALSTLIRSRLASLRQEIHDPETIAHSVLQVIEQTLLHHPDLTPLLSEDARIGVLTHLQPLLVPLHAALAVADASPASPEQSGSPQPAEDPSSGMRADAASGLNVLAFQEDLMNLPEHLLSSLTLTLAAVPGTAASVGGPHDA